MVDKFVICIRYLVTLRYALSDKWGFPFHSGISLGVVSSSQRTKGDKKNSRNRWCSDYGSKSIANCDAF